MQVNVQKLTDVLVECAVEIPADTVRAEVERAYAELARNTRVSGFRKGKAPRNVLAQLFGRRVEEDVARRLMNSTVQEAIKEQNLQSLSEISLSAGRVQPTSNFTYKARFEVPPDIAEVKYEGIAVKRPSVTVSDEQLNEELEGLRKKHGTLKSPEPARAAKAGDAAVIDYALSIDGNSVKEGSAEGIEVELGSSTLLPELNTAIIGMNAGESKDVSITFSANHPREDFRGKSGVFKVTLKEVKELVLPNLDDEFAKDLAESFGGVETLDALKEAVKKQIGKNLEQAADDAVAQQIVDALVDTNQVSVPPSLVRKQMEITWEEWQIQARREGRRIELTAPLRDELQRDSEKKVRAGLLMAAIAKNQQIKIGDEDIEKAYVTIAEQTNEPVARVKAQYRDASKRELLLGMILEDKILTLIQEKAAVTQE